MDDDAIMRGVWILKDKGERPYRILGDFELPKTNRIQQDVRTFLEKHLAGLTGKAPTDLRSTARPVKTPLGTVARFQQTHEGTLTDIIVHLKPTGRVQRVDLQQMQETGIRVTPLGETPTKKAARRVRPSGIDGTGSVFDPNPVVTARNASLRSPTSNFRKYVRPSAQALIDAQRRSDVILRDIKKRADGKYMLEGPYLRIMAKKGQPLPTEKDPNSFIYTSNDPRFEAVMVYYHVDTVQRYLQHTLGIRGACDWPIESYPHDDECRSPDDNPEPCYQPATKSLHFASGFIKTWHRQPLNRFVKPDAAEDAHCILHEYAHAILDDLVPGFASVDADGINPQTGHREAVAIAEGFATIFATVYFAPDHPFQSHLFETWYYAHKPDIPENRGRPPGLRIVNEFQQYRTKKWPDDEHNAGTIWSGALWDIYATTGGRSMSRDTRAHARDRLLKAYLCGHRHLARNASMADAAEWFMDMYLTLYPECGIHAIPILQSFHRHRILRCRQSSDLTLQGMSQVRVVPNSTHATSFAQPLATIRNGGNEEIRAAVVLFSTCDLTRQPIHPNEFRNHVVGAAVEFNIGPNETRTIAPCWQRAVLPKLFRQTLNVNGSLLAAIWTPGDRVSTLGRNVAQEGKRSVAEIAIVR